MDTEWICFDAVTGYDKGELNHAAQILRQGGLLPSRRRLCMDLAGMDLTRRRLKKYMRQKDVRVIIH